MLACLQDPDLWQEFFNYKQSLQLLTKREEAALQTFLDEKRYLPIASGIAAGTYVFSCPERKALNKLGSAKKRIVYTYTGNETLVLKLLAFLLHRYDSELSPNCYAFRQHIGPRRAFADVLSNPALSQLCSFKSDITNYFNSIDITLLEPILRRVIPDEKLVDFLLRLLQDDRALWQGEVIHEKKGVMAGTPIAPFLANLYLMEMDAYFHRQGVCYARYSDDIILFDAAEQMPAHIAAYRGFLEKYRLQTNPAKEQFTHPGEAWTFLGFSYDSGRIDISAVAVKKLMGKIRRAARSLRRWMLAKEADPERALRAFNKKFNRKFYAAQLGRELCWARWFFPLINSTDALHRIDSYMQECQRFLVTGRHNKANYDKVPYETLKRCGYRPLVSAYYQRQTDKKRAT